MDKQSHRTPGRFSAVVYAIFVHAAVVAVLVIGVRFSKAPTPPPAMIKAVVVEDPKIHQQAHEDQQKKVEEDTKRKQQVERERLEQERKQEEERHQLEEKHKKEEQQKLEQQKLEEQKKLDEKKLVEAQKRKEEESKKAEAERKRQADLKAKQEKDEKRRKDEAKKKDDTARQKVAEDSLKQQLEAEEKERAEEEDAARVGTEVDRYQALMKKRIHTSWNVPFGTPEGTSCVVRIQLLPDGEVVDATVVESSGNPVFDRSAESAIKKSSPLPVSSDVKVFNEFREFKLKMVKPKNR